MRWPPRYSKVPWLGPCDLEPFGRPEISLRREATIAHVLRIPTPWGRNTEAMLVIQAHEVTGVITVHEAASTVPPPVDAREWHSNPRRVTDDDDEVA